MSFKVKGHKQMFLTIIRRTGFVTLAAGALLIAGGSSVQAGTITAQGSVTALTDVSQLGTVVGNANFDEGPTSGFVPLGTYSGAGMTLYHLDTLASILPGVTTLGSAFNPLYDTVGSFFPGPIGGGGEQTGQIGFLGGVATFSVSVTQFGLTFSKNGTQYITAWDSAGTLIGQVTWAPSADSAFVGLDTGGVDIAMIAVGNDNLFGGATYGVSGVTIISDTWKWAGASTVPEPGTLALFGLGLAGLGVMRRRRAV